MFAKTPRDPSEKQYLFDVSKYYKIWFSIDPELFLGIENQLRFVRMRRNNPNETLYFIYSQTCLSPKAISELTDFCDQYAIIPIVFEEIEKLLQNDMDKMMYSLAKEEINQALAKTGGNMAAAADITRLIVPVIEAYGIYTDFDVQTQLSDFKTQFITLRGPLLFNAELVINALQANVILSPNTDFLAFSVNENNKNMVSDDALIAIRHVQMQVIENYKRPIVWDKISLNVSANDMEMYPELPKLVDEFYKQHPDNPSIFDFRIYTSSLPDLLAKEGQMEPIKSLLFRLSVINISGPGICSLFFKSLIPHEYKHMPTFISYKNKNWLPYLELYERCEIGFYDPIFDKIDTNNKLSNCNSSKKGEVLCDQSWTEKGMSAKIQREEQLLHTSTVLQGACKRHMLWKACPEDALFFKIKTICSQQSTKSPRIDNNHMSLLTTLRDKNYALTLRKACIGLKLSIVKLLLEYKEKQGIDFDLNEASVSTGKTALDMVLESKPSSKTGQGNKAEIIKLLKDAGAQMAKESANLETSMCI